MSDLGDSCDINYLQGRVAGSLKIDNSGLLGQSSLYSIKISEINKLGVDAEVRHAMVQESEGAAVQCIGSNDFVAGLGSAPQSSGDSAHTGSGSCTCLSALEVSKLLLNLGK